MKRLALLVITALVALTLTACGDNAEKKVESKAADTLEQTSTPEAKPADATLTTDPAPTTDNNTAAPADNNAATDAAKPE